MDDLFKIHEAYVMVVEINNMTDYEIDWVGSYTAKNLDGGTYISGNESIPPGVAKSTEITKRGGILGLYTTLSWQVTGVDCQFSVYSEMGSNALASDFFGGMKADCGEIRKGVGKSLHRKSNPEWDWYDDWKDEITWVNGSGISVRAVYLPLLSRAHVAYLNNSSNCSLLDWSAHDPSCVSQSLSESMPTSSWFFPFSARTEADCRCPKKRENPPTYMRYKMAMMEGRRFRSPDRRVMLVLDGKLRHVENMGALTSMFGDNARFDELNLGEADLMPKGHALTANPALIQDAAGSKIYLVDEDKKRWIRDPPTFERYGFVWDRVVKSDEQVARYADGAVIER